MAIAEFTDVPIYLITDQGVLSINDPGSADGFFVAIDESSQGGTRVRSSKDDIPQADGSILHRRFLTGYEVTLTLTYMASNKATATCQTEPSSRAMNDTLMLHLMELVHDNGRLLFYPTGAADARLLDQIQLLNGPVISIEPGVTSVTFTVDSPFPYLLNYTQIDTEIVSGGPETLVNGGTAPMYPVFQVYGPTDYFEIWNNDTDLAIVYDSALPGAQSIASGDYAEIDTFRNTIYLNGDQDNLKPGIDITASDFFPLEVGSNEIEVTGDGTFSGPPLEVHVLWQDAWF